MVTTARVKVADQVWIALALLTREQPEREGFTASEIIAKVGLEFGRVSAGVSTHVSQHCIASKAPSPGRYRMITKTSGGLNRLFRPGDAYHLGREGGRMTPDAQNLPEERLPLLDWYEADYAGLVKVFTIGSDFLKLKPGDSGLSDISENINYYLVDAWLNRTTRIDIDKE